MEDLTSPDWFPMADRAILITGGTGYLGRRIVRRASVMNRIYVGSNRAAVQAPAGEIVFCDIGDRTSVLSCVQYVQPSVIVHAAAVNPGQGDYEAMWRVNADGARHIAAAATRVGARLIAISSDVVHDGKSAPYGDDVPPSPINIYGRTKAAAEESILDIDPSAVIVRTSLMYGLDTMDRGTAGFADRLVRNEPLQLFTDVIRNPIWVETLAQAIVRLADTDVSGLLNIAGRQAVTREDYARKLFAHWNIDDRGLIEPVRAADISDTIPLDLRLDSTRAEHLLGMPFPGIDEVLAGNRRPR